MGGSGGSYLRNRKGLNKEDLERLLRRHQDDDAYLFDVEYEKLKKENEKLRAEYEKARQEYLKISEQLRREMENGTASASAQERFMAMLSERGVQLQQQQEEAQANIEKIANQRGEIDRQLAQLRQQAFSGSTRASVPANPQEKYQGFKKDNWGQAKVVEMSPTEYLRRMAFQFGYGNIEGILRTASPQDIEKWAREMRRGTRYNAPSLDYKGSKVSGNEKVLAALLNGYKRIPVLIIE